MASVREILRKEATAVGFLELTESQRDAVDKLSDLLREALEISDDEPSKERRSRVVLVSGGKGCGKTSLVHSLRDLMENRDVFEKLAGKGSQRVINGAKGRLERFVQIRNRLQTRFGNDLQRSDRKVTWLEMLHLDPMAPGTNLTAAVLARIHHLANRDEQVGRPSGLLDPITHMDRAKHELESLQNSAVTSLEGNLEQRAPALDADAFAVNAMDVERQKLEVAKKLNDILGSLAAGVAGNPTKTKGLFVLPVDDMDVRPSRAVQMLKLATMLSIPRLFFLFLGETDAIDQVLFYETQGEYIRLLGPALAGRKEIADSIEAKSNEIASSLLRKFLPPAQRIRLDAMTLGEALLYPQGLKHLSPDKGDNRKTLDELLGDIEVPVAMAGPGKTLPPQGAPPTQETPPTRCTLRDLWIPPSLFGSRPAPTPAEQAPTSRASDPRPTSSASPDNGPESALGYDDKRRIALVETTSHYDGSKLIAGPPRQVADLWSELRDLTAMEEAAAGRDQDARDLNALIQHLDGDALERAERIIKRRQSSPSQRVGASGETAAEGVIGIFVRAFQSIVDEDPNPGVSLQRELKASITPPAGTTSGLWEMSPPDIQVVSTFGDKIELTFDAEALPPSAVIGREVLVHEIEAKRTPHDSTPEKAFQRVGSRTRVAYKATHDLMRMTGRGIVTSNFVHQNRADMACSIWDDSSAESLVIPWSFIEWPTFWHQDTYTAIWNKGIATVRKIANQKADLKGQDLALVMLLYRAAAAVETIELGPTRASNLGGSLARPEMAGRTDQDSPPKDPGKWYFDDLKIVDVTRDLEGRLGGLRREVAERRNRGEDDAEADRIDDALLDLALLGTPEVLFALPDPKSRGAADAHFVSRREAHTRLGELLYASARELLAGRPELAPRFRRLRLSRIGAHILGRLGLSFVAPDSIEKVGDGDPVHALAAEVGKAQETYPHLEIKAHEVEAFFRKQRYARFRLRGRKTSWEQSGELQSKLAGVRPPRASQA